MRQCLVIQKIADPGLELLKRAGLIVQHPSTTDFATLEPHLSVASAVITRNHGLSAQEIAAAPKLKAIVSHGSGTDAIDKAAAEAREIPVFSTPGANAIAVAELTMALMLSCARQLPQADAATRRGDTRFRYDQTGFELNGKTLGLVGYGRVAQRVALLGINFGMRVLACSQHVGKNQVHRDGVELVDLEELCARSDIVSLHAVPAPRPLFDAARIATLKTDAMLINTARGALIDEAALIAALKGGHLYGAALDVVMQEPLRPGNPLLSCPGLILTPHIGGAAKEAMERTAIDAASHAITALGLEVL